jgi:hypothetical protein
LTSEHDEDREETVRRRAYRRYEERGREEGRDIEDWLEAEKESAGEQEETAPVVEVGPSVPVDEGDVGERSGEVMVNVSHEDQRQAASGRMPSAVAG